MTDVDPSVPVHHLRQRTGPRQSRPAVTIRASRLEQIEEAMADLEAVFADPDRFHSPCILDRIHRPEVKSAEGWKSNHGILKVRIPSRAGCPRTFNV